MIQSWTKKIKSGRCWNEDIFSFIDFDFFSLKSCQYACSIDIKGSFWCCNICHNTIFWINILDTNIELKIIFNEMSEQIVIFITTFSSKDSIFGTMSAIDDVVQCIGFLLLVAPSIHQSRKVWFRQSYQALIWYWQQGRPRRLLRLKISLSTLTKSRRSRHILSAKKELRHLTNRRIIREI